MPCYITDLDGGDSAVRYIANDIFGAQFVIVCLTIKYDIPIEGR